MVWLHDFQPLTHKDAPTSAATIIPSDEYRSKHLCPVARCTGNHQPTVVHMGLGDNIQTNTYPLNYGLCFRIAFTLHNFGVLHDGFMTWRCPQRQVANVFGGHLIFEAGAWASYLCNGGQTLHAFRACLWGRVWPCNEGTPALAHVIPNRADMGCSQAPR